MADQKDHETTPDIDSLIDGAINGKAEDFAKLYDFYVERIYRHIYYRVGNTGDTEDLTQQVFLKAWKAIGRYKRTASPFLAWLLRISHNLVIDFYRSRKDTAYLENEQAIEDRKSGPAQLAEEYYEQQQIRKVIRKLPEDQQQVIIMSFIEGFSYSEIATAMGKREGNVRVIMHRALKKMRQIMETEKTPE